MALTDGLSPLWRRVLIGAVSVLTAALALLVVATVLELHQLAERSVEKTEQVEQEQQRLQRTVVAVNVATIACLRQTPPLATTRALRECVVQGMRHQLRAPGGD